MRVGDSFPLSTTAVVAGPTSSRKRKRRRRRRRRRRAAKEDDLHALSTLATAAGPTFPRKARATQKRRKGKIRKMAIWKNGKKEWNMVGQQSHATQRRLQAHMGQSDICTVPFHLNMVYNKELGLQTAQQW